MFAVRRTNCIGRKCGAHARELGSDPPHEPPLFLHKPTDAIQNVTPGTVADHLYPTLTNTTTTRWHWSPPCTGAVATLLWTTRWRKHMAQGERPAEAERRPAQHNLERGAADRPAVAGVRAPAQHRLENTHRLEAVFTPGATPTAPR